MRRLWYCDNNTATVSMFENFEDSYDVPTAMGTKTASSLVGSDKASITIPGINTDGGITYTARHGGKLGNSLRITHETGDQGPGHPDRPMVVTRDGMHVIVTYGTNGSGTALTPTSGDVEALVAANQDISNYIVAAAEGTGTGSVNLAPAMPLIGGADTGDWRKFSGPQGICRRINTVEVV